MKRIAIFLDAPYFWSQTSHLLAGRHAPRNQVQMDLQSLREHLLNEAEDQLPDGDLLRVYWYDVPARSGKTPEHHAIDQLDDVKLRLAARAGVGQQGGLDSLLITDLMGLAQQRAITHALVVSGSADLAPALLAVQGMGLRVHLLSLGGATATLAAEADLKRVWGLEQLDRFATWLGPAQEPGPEAYLGTALGGGGGGGNGGSGGSSGNGGHGMGGMGWVPPVADAQTPSLVAVAQAASAHIKDGPLAMVFAALKPGVRALPREIDSALLAVGRDELGRALTESEKRELRREFQALVKQDFEDKLRQGHGNASDAYA